MEMFFNAVITAMVFIGIYAVLLLFVRRKERMFLIEKGANPPEFKQEVPVFSSLKFGLFFIGIGIGVFAGSILAATTVLNQEVAYFSMIFLFGGLSLVIHHLVDKNQKKNQG
jgi:predicted MFS family arabinose efflux permease